VPRSSMVGHVAFREGAHRVAAVGQASAGPPAPAASAAARTGVRDTPSAPRSSVRRCARRRPARRPGSFAQPQLRLDGLGAAASLAVYMKSSTRGMGAFPLRRAHARSRSRYCIHEDLSPIIRPSLPTARAHHVSQERLVRRLHPRRNRRQAPGAHHLQREDRLLPRRRRPGRRGGRTSARTAARSCRWARVRRQPGLRLPRPGHGLRRQDRVHARPARGRLPEDQGLPGVEKYGFIWVWPGDAAAGRPREDPPPGMGREPDWAYGGGCTTSPATTASWSTT
jgi:hypothetical protein